MLINNFSKVVTGTTPSTKNNKYYSSDDYMFISPEDLKNNRYIQHSKRYISYYAYDDYKSRFIPENSIVIDCIGSDMGNVAITSKTSLTNQQINAITNINTNIVKPLYLYYLLSTYKNFFHSIGSNGSTMPIISKSLFENINVDIKHNLTEQQHIVDIIGSIDDKIENNNKIIEKSYELLDLRMKKLMIGKSKKIISDFKKIEIIGSGINKFDREKIYLDTSCVSGNSIIDTSYNVSYNERPSRANMQPIINSVWFAKLKNSPKHIIVKDYSNEILNNYVFSTGFMGIKMPEEKFDLLAIYFISDIFDKEKDSLSIGATMQSINNNTFKNMYIPKFIENDYKEFNDISNDILKAIYSMELENYKLNKLKQLYLKKFFG